MRFPHDVADRAATHYRSRLTALLADDSYTWSLPLQPPTATGASANFDTVQDFIRTWQAWSGPGTVLVEDRNWNRAGLGTQPVPFRIETSSSADLAELAGESAAFAELKEKLALLGSEHRERALEVLPLWKDLPTTECAWVPKVVAWFRDNPSSGLRPRAVSVAGVHGKWLEHNLRLIRHLLDVEDLGLVSGDRLIRLKILDPTLGAGLTDISTPVAEAATLWQVTGPRIAVIVENKETFLSLTTPWAGVIAVWGAGYAVDVLDHLPWLHRCQRILYWGDLDADGFGILHRLRSRFNNVESLMMSSADVHRWAHLGVPDPGDSATALPLLTATEADARRALLTQGDIRIEQERIPWNVAHSTLDELVREANP